MSSEPLISDTETDSIGKYRIIERRKTMAKEFVRDFYGHIMGSLEDQGDKIIARDFPGRIVGYYYKSENRTRDFYGRIVSEGDTTAALIAKADAENR